MCVNPIFKKSYYFLLFKSSLYNKYFKFIEIFSNKSKQFFVSEMRKTRNLINYLRNLCKLRNLSVKKLYFYSLDSQVQCLLDSTVFYNVFHNIYNLKIIFSNLHYLHVI